MASREMFLESVRATLHDAAADTQADPATVERLLRRPRGHRRRIVWSRGLWLAPVVAAVAVLVVAVATVALSGRRVAQQPGPATDPRPPTSTTVPPPTSPSAAQTDTPSPATTTPSRAPSPILSTATGLGPPPSVPAGRWTDARLTITPTSLGAVTRGMTNGQADAAAGISPEFIGDSIFGIDRGSTRLQYSWGTTCFDGTRRGSGPGAIVTTPAGVSLGDPMSSVAVAYGSQAQMFAPDPAWGGAGNVPAGLIVTTSDGVLLFVGSSGSTGTITSIRGAETPQRASSTFC